LSKISEAIFDGTLPPQLQRQADLILLRELAALYPTETAEIAAAQRRDRQVPSKDC